MEADFHEVYGIDLGDKVLLRSRTWRWLAVRLLGLVSTESRLQRVLRPIETQTGAKVPETN